MNEGSKAYQTGEFVRMEGRCGHEWAALISEFWACPFCGDYDGNAHLVDHGTPLKELTMEHRETILLKTTAALIYKWRWGDPEQPLQTFDPNEVEHEIELPIPPTPFVPPPPPAGFERVREFAADVVEFISIKIRGGSDVW